MISKYNNKNKKQKQNVKAITGLERERIGIERKLKKKKKEELTATTTEEVR